MTTDYTLWDQKISNELIYERNHLFIHPPYFSVNPPLSDNLRNIKTNSKSFLNITKTNEEKLANYWYTYIYKNKPGLAVRNYKSNEVLESLESLTYKFPNKPWLEGITYNINIENILKYNNYTCRDCINLKELNNLYKKNMEASINMIDKYFGNSNIYPNNTKKWFNNNTKAKNND